MHRLVTWSSPQKVNLSKFFSLFFTKMKLLWTPAFRLAIHPTNIPLKTRLFRPSLALLLTVGGECLK